MRRLTPRCGYLPFSAATAGCATRRPRSSAKRLTGDSLQLQAAAGRAVGLRQHERRPRSRAAWMAAQRGSGELRRAGKDDTQRLRCIGQAACETRERQAPDNRLQRASRASSCLPRYASALQRRQVFDEHLAVQVVHLVLDAHGEQALGVELERLARRGRARAPSPRRARRRRRCRAPTGSLPRTPGFALAADDFRVDEDLRLRRASSRHVDHDAAARARRPGVAARPTPGASYIVSAMSATSLRMRSSTTATGLATLFSRLSG